jgi:hypothetical protein
MKNYLFVLLLLITQVSFTQETETYYQTINKEYTFKFTGEVCTLYQLSENTNYAYREWELERVNRFKGQLDSLGILFSNGKYAISYDYKYFCVLKLKHGKQKDRLTFVAKKLADPSNVYEAINHAYWYGIYWKTIEEVKEDYPLFGEYRHRIYFRSDYEWWQSLSFKRETPEKFELLAGEQNQLLKDSLLRTNRQLIFLNDSIENSINTLTVDELKRNLMSRPIHVPAYDEYQDSMLQMIAVRRPDLFYELAEALPEERKYLFNKVSYGEPSKSLKKFDTDSPVREEFLKYRRRENLKAGLIMTSGVLLEAGVIGGAITGIVFWIRK